MMDIGQLMVNVSEVPAESSELNATSGVDFDALIGLPDDETQGDKNPFMALMMSMMNLAPPSEIPNNEGMPNSKDLAEQEASIAIADLDEVENPHEIQLISDEYMPDESQKTDLDALPVVDEQTGADNILTQDIDIKAVLQWIDAKAFVPPQANAMTNREEGSLQIDVLDYDSVQGQATLIANKPEVLPETAEDTSVQQDLDVRLKPQDIESQIKITSGTETPSAMTMLQSSTPFRGPTITPNTPLEITASVDASEWGQEFAEHVVWLGQQNMKSALINIHPEALGPIAIRVDVQQDTASVSIASHSMMVRDIIDQSMPQLRDMMQTQGIQLGDVQISSDANPKYFTRQEPSTSSTLESDEESKVEITALNSRQPQGLVDYFA